MKYTPSHYAYKVSADETESVAGKILGLVGIGKRVLELGCASGSMSKALAEFNHCNVTGVELDPEAAKIAEAYCERIEVADLDHASLTTLFPDEQFDVIIAADVIEHLANPQQVMSDFVKLLSEEGYAIFSTPNIAYAGIIGSLSVGHFSYSDSGLLDQTHRHFFTRHELEADLLAAGLVPAQVESVRLAPSDSEFIEQWSRLTHSQQQTILEGNPDANVYQWIFKATPTGRVAISHFLKQQEASQHQLRLALSAKQVSWNQLQHEVTLLHDQKKQLSLQKKQLSLQKKQLSLQNEQLFLQNEQLSREFENHHFQLGEILQSNSWRITSPLRKISSTARHFHSIYQRLGGIRGARDKGIRAWNSDGIRGVVEGIKRAHSSQNLHCGDYILWRQSYHCRPVYHSLSGSPLISILLPTYNSNLEWLEGTINSVINQSYSHWELCIADDASTNPKVLEQLRAFVKQDSRIHLHIREENGHISAASNSALSMARGDFVALLDHDDLLDEDALFWVAYTLEQSPDSGLIYSDEDKVSVSGIFSEPHFKPDWNPELFLCYNYLCHFTIIRTSLIQQIGGFREGFEGAQDYDLFLRCSEQLSANQITHIPRVLYHWRSHQESTAQAITSKPYAAVAAERALEEHFTRTHLAAAAEYNSNGFFRIHYTLPERLPKVSIIIPTRDGLELLRQCIDSILERTTYPNYEIIVVDNGSEQTATLDYFSTLGELSNIQILRDERPFNYAALNNQAVEHTQGEVICLLNNDIEVITPEWLEEMVGMALQPEIGAVGARLWYPDHTLQHGGVILGLGGVAGHSHKFLPHNQPGYFNRARIQQSFSAITAACLVIRKETYQAVNGLDEALQVAFNDVDFCIRIREEGYRNVWTPYAELFHHESASRGHEDTPEKQARFEQEIKFMKQRWGTLLDSDPAYNPNLTVASEDFVLACPPRVNCPK
ncbi:MAG: glycosyltransferase [Thiotrichales bacterium]|jgi:O-antigen biosynthesis protein|nr:glycosyltransferase [Gammaproteobacteria bacterium]MBT4607369.1 glycosyltransferase [Thiotrichales bacterium]